MNYNYIVLGGLVALALINAIATIVVRSSPKLNKEIGLLTFLLKNGDLAWDKINDKDLELINSCDLGDIYGYRLR